MDLSRLRLSGVFETRRALVLRDWGVFEADRRGRAEEGKVSAKSTLSTLRDLVTISAGYHRREIEHTLHLFAAVLDALAFLFRG
jgi:hypothetical protein